MSTSLLTPARPILSGAGLTSSECYQLAIAARCLPGAWDVQWDKDDRGHVNVALLEECTTANMERVFLVWRENGHLHLGVGDDHRYTGLGTHADLDSVMNAVRRASTRVKATEAAKLQ